MSVQLLEVSTLTWRWTSTCPPDWVEKVERCGGGFFHTPPGLAVGAPRGDRLFAEVSSGDNLIGIAAAVKSRCRFTQDPRHVYLPTLPALPSRDARETSLSALVELFKEEGAAEVVVDAFDARWKPGALPAAEDTRARQEYIVNLNGTSEELSQGFSRHHQRGLRRGQREGWALRTHEGAQARDVLRLVQHAAAERAAQRRDAFVLEPPPPTSALIQTDAWGVSTFGAWNGTALLAAALVGWANRRAFYLRGGSTPDGYRSNAAVWLHWRIMSQCAERGFTEYNLGGAPTNATRPQDPAHGLHRFKRDFGTDVRPCRGLRWTLSEPHVQAHRMARWAQRETPDEHQVPVSGASLYMYNSRNGIRTGATQA
jgi:hypothetical protein